MDTFQVNRDFLVREIAGEFILIPTKQAALQFNGLAALNETGAFLWNLLQEPRTVPELARPLAETYGLTEEESRRDVEDFLALALSRELVFKEPGK